jgi:hypothetical protein
VSPWTFKRGAELYAQGRTLRQIGAELGIPWTVVGHQLRQAGRSGPVISVSYWSPPALLVRVSFEASIGARCRSDIEQAVLGVVKAVERDHCFALFLSATTAWRSIRSAKCAGRDG